MTTSLKNIKESSSFDLRNVIQFVTANLHSDQSTKIEFKVKRRHSFQFISKIDYDMEKFQSNIHNIQDDFIVE